MSCTIYFTPGTTPAIGQASKNAPSVTGNFVSDTELTAMTPDFGDKGNCAIVQLSFASNDLTTTFAEFNFFLDTRADKSLCYGPGLMQECCVAEPCEFIIQARNEQEENRTSGRDEFQVTVTPRDVDPFDIPVTIEDADDGKYYVKYTVEQEVQVDVRVQYQDNKGNWKNVRGSPYSASFVGGVAPNVNLLTGPAMVKNAQKKIESMQTFLKETHSGASTKDKDLSDVKALISVKDCVEQVYTKNDSTTLNLD